MDQEDQNKWEHLILRFFLKALKKNPTLKEHQPILFFPFNAKELVIPEKLGGYAF